MEEQMSVNKNQIQGSSGTGICSPWTKAAFIPVIPSIIWAMTGCGCPAQATGNPSSTDTPWATASPSPTTSRTLKPSPTPYPFPQGIFEPFPDEFYENTFKLAFGSVLQEEIAEEKILVDSSIGWAVFHLSWQSGDLDLTLVQPDGAVIDPSVAVPLDGPVLPKDRILFSSDSKTEFYEIRAPMRGEWTAMIFGKSLPQTGSPYKLEGHGTSSLDVSVELDRNEYSPGDRIQLTASAMEGLFEPENLLEVVIMVTAKDPAGREYHFRLYDDGMHSDKTAGDGVFANAFGNTQLTGRYNFFIEINGDNMIGSSSGYTPAVFSRLWFCSANVR
jgi:hypothetical protein